MLALRNWLGFVATRSANCALPPSLAVVQSDDLRERDDLTISDHTLTMALGLEGASIPSLWRGALIGRTLRVKMWRVAAQELPATARGRVGWLYRQWAQADDWVESVLES